MVDYLPLPQWSAPQLVVTLSAYLIGTGFIVFVATISRPGAWMFMCMLPYHMQMGMMGQIATPGMAMRM